MVLDIFLIVLKKFNNCLQSEPVSFELVIDGDGCPINQKLGDTQITGFGVDDNGEGWFEVSDKLLELVSKNLFSFYNLTSYCHYFYLYHFSLFLL